MKYTAAGEQYYSSVGITLTAKYALFPTVKFINELLITGRREDGRKKE
jgi:hypothetical protein